MFVGRYWFLALKYKPQALQMVSPFGPRRHNGVVVVPQFAQTVANASGEISLVPFFGSSGTSSFNCEFDTLADDIQDW